MTKQTPGGGSMESKGPFVDMKIFAAYFGQNHKYNVVFFLNFSHRVYIYIYIY